MQPSKSVFFKIGVFLCRLFDRNSFTYDNCIIFKQRCVDIMIKPYHFFFLALSAVFSLQSMETKKDNIKIVVKGLLFGAANNGDEETFAIAIAMGADVNEPNDAGVFPLYTAAQYGHIRIVTMLKMKGAVIDAVNGSEGYQAVHVAASTGNLNALKLLIGFGASPTARSTKFGIHPLHFAARAGRYEVAEYLVERGASVHARTDLGATPLILAAQGGHLQMVRWLLGQGADINAADNEQNTALINALLEGHQDVAQYLLENGAEINASNASGTTPMAIAQYRNLGAVIIDLILKGLDANSKIKALQRILDVNEPATQLELLLKNGIPIDLPDEKDRTLLCFAVKEKKSNIVRLALNHKANVNLRNKEGFAPIHIAASHEVPEILLRLLEAGASVHVPEAFTLDMLNPVGIAILKGQLTALETLLAWGGSVNSVSVIETKDAIRLALEQKNPGLIEWLLTHGAHLNEVSRLALTLYYGTLGKCLLSAIIGDDTEYAKKYLDQERNSGEILEEFELNLGLPLAVALGREEVIETMITEYKEHLTLDSLKQALISAVARSNWKLFQKLYALVEDRCNETLSDMLCNVLSSSEAPTSGAKTLREILSSALLWCATLSGDVSLFQELYRSASGLLSREELELALNDSLARATLQGSEEIVSFILASAFTDTVRGDLRLDVGRAGSLARLRLGEERLPEEYRASLIRIHENLALIGRMRRTNRQANNRSVVNSLGGILAATGNEFAAAIPAEVRAIILYMAFRPANKHG